MFLVDTNIFLEILLDQKDADIATKFLTETDPSKLFISDFSLHSIGVILFRLDNWDVLAEFIQDVIIDGGVTVVHIEPTGLASVGEVAQSFDLDFDDAYQYTVSKKFDLQIVSFDGDFDKTDRGKSSPSEG